jgi:prolyl oligopeptidase
MIRLLLFLIAVPAWAQATGLPSAPVRDVAETHYGVTVHDPYRYMEEPDNPEAQTWAREQAALVAARLEALPARKAIYERARVLEAEQGAEVSNILRVSLDRFFYQKREPGRSPARLYERVSGQERLVLDPETFAGKSGGPALIDHYSVSPDGHYLACGISLGGSENAALYVIELASGKQNGFRIERVRWGPVNWLPDSSGFFYNQLQPLAPGASRQDVFQRSRVFLHRVDERAGDPDQAVFGSDLNETVNIRASELPFVMTYKGCDQAFGYVTTGVSGDYAVYTCPLARINGARTPWVKIADMSDQVGAANASFMGLHGDDLYLLSRHGATNGKVIRTSLKNPDLRQATTVYTDPKGVIQSLVWARDGLYLKILEGGPSRLVRLPFDRIGQPDEIRLPDTGTVSVPGSGTNDTRLPGVAFTLGSWTRPGLYYAYDPRSENCTDTGVIPDWSPAISARLTVKRVRVKSHDGMEIPLTIIHPQGLELNGKNPVLLSGYGAYGTSSEPRFNLGNVPFFEAGGIYAVAHVRGGGEYGESWRRAGFQDTKPNTWKDFIACADYLVTAGYASPQTICGMGRSAGGILIGRAITERPDLFGAAVIGVGVCDALRMEYSANGVPNIPEFGSVKTEQGFRALLEMSSYHQIKDGTAYPAVLLIHGANDTRVDLWQSMKMAARLQAASAGGRPIWLRIDYSGGHGKGQGGEQKRAQDADMLAFLLDHCGRSQKP